MAPLSIQTYVVGPVQTNCYFAINDDTKEVLIIDPGASAKQLALEGNVELWDRDTLKEYLRDKYSAERNSKNEAENLESLSPSTGLETASSEPLPNAVENDESDWSDF